MIDRCRFPAVLALAIGGQLPSVEVVSVRDQSSGPQSGARGVRPVSDSDVGELSECLCRAFYDDPVTLYLFPSERTRRPRLERYFRWQLHHVFLPKGEAWTTDDLSGASLWMPHRSRPPGLVEGLGQLATALRLLGVRLPDALRLLGELEAKHPREPHCYLGTIGTEPARQGSGVGSSLMTVVLDRLDSEALPAYLESSKEQNLAFYYRHGFSVTGEIGGSGGLPRLWLMWREPRPPSGA